MPEVFKCAAPTSSLLCSSLDTAWYHDSYALDLPRDGRSALQLYLDTVSRTPAWIDAAMRMRNKLVNALFGLKDLGALSEVDAAVDANDYALGQRIGIFSLLELRNAEVVLGDSDRHLEVKVSVHRSDTVDGMRVVITTVVHVRNALGKAYMLVVAPAHRLIAPAMLARLQTVR